MPMLALRQTFAALGALLLCSFAPAQTAPTTEVTHIHCGTLLAVPGEPPRTEMTITVIDGKIEQISDGYTRPDDNATVIDLRDRFVLPGLFDCHTHITGQFSRNIRLRRLMEHDADAAIDGVVYAKRTIDAGFTTIRNVGSSGRAAFALRDAIKQNKVPGPRILVAGESITPTGGHSDGTLGYREDIFEVPEAMQGVADGIAECRAAVRSQVKRGADLIKLTATGGVLSNTAAGVEQQFFKDELRAIVETGHLLGRRVAAHAHGATGIKAALEAGVDSIEHGTYTDDECIALFIETGAFLVPTIHAGKFVAEKAEQEGYFMGPVRHKAAMVGPLMQETFGRAYRAGVRIAFGTDVGVGAHGTNALEFIYMTEAGMTNEDAIISATINAAELCDLSDELGTLEPGKIADVIAVDGNPLETIEALLEVPFVMRDGIVFKHDD
ncbi:MAG: amidohydrolase family protein [Planctomycetota bacterium]